VAVGAGERAAEAADTAGAVPAKSCRHRRLKKFSADSVRRVKKATVFCPLTSCFRNNSGHCACERLAIIIPSLEKMAALNV